MKTWKKNFFTIFIGQAFSQISSSVLQFAIVWYLTDITNSAMVLSIAMLMGFLPKGIVGFFAGSFIDRFDRKKIMIYSDLIIALACLVLSIVGFFQKIPIWLIMCSLAVRSVGTAFHNPALQAVTPSLVPEDELVRCSGYSQTLQSVSLILSPAIAAVLYSSLSLNIIILLDVLGALIAVFTLLISYVPKINTDKIKINFNVFADSVEGFKILKSNKGALTLVMVGAIYTIALMPTSALFPLMTMSYFSGSSKDASFIEIVFSIGFLIGSVILSKFAYNKNKINTIIFSCIIMSLSLFVSGFISKESFNIFACMSFLMGFSGPFYWGMYSTILQTSFEDIYLGRVMSLSNSISFLTSPFSLYFSGIFSEKFGVNNWFTVAGVITLFMVIICLFSKSIRKTARQTI